MKFKLACLFFLYQILFVWDSSGQQSKSLSNVSSNRDQVRKLKATIVSRQKVESIKLQEYAQQNGITTGKIYQQDRVIQLRKMSAENTPLFYTTFNADAAVSTGAASLATGGSLGLDLNGQGMTIGIWDGDAVRSTHVEFGGRVSQVDDVVFSGANSGSNHATHVAGTLAASGVANQAQGMAPSSDIHAYDWESDDMEMIDFASNGFLISNHSYGFCTDTRPPSEGGCNWQEWRFGYYGEAAQNWDAIAVVNPYYLIVKASGNDLDDNKNIFRNGFDLLESAGTAKNVLVVGAAEDMLSYTSPESVVLASFSSTGPTDDGRIKPDILGNGVGLTSSTGITDEAYSSFNGTSMASPSVTGTLALLQQHYNNLNQSFMLSATLRGLVIHTAREAGNNPGPDYRHGWGMINAEEAANLISENGESTHIEEHILLNGESFQKVVEADGFSPLVATICWTDREGEPLPENSTSENSTSRMLVNDLDSRITKDQDEFQPWTLNPSNLGAAASTGDNSRDNVEKIEIEAPEAGLYTINISHKSVLIGGSQSFSLIVSGAVPSSCVAVQPSNINAGNITTESAIISWDALIGVSNYAGRYRELGSTNWLSFASTSNQFTLTDLLSGTYYEVEIQSLCSTINSSLFSENFSFQTECRADVPENISYGNITTSGIRLSWDTVRAVEQFEIRYRLAGDAVWSTTASTITNLTLAELSAGETYEFQINSQCSAQNISDYSAIQTFTTYCIARGESSENEWIERIQIGSIDNTSGNNSGYADFTHLQSTLNQGSEVTIGLQAGLENYFNSFWSVWIDLNQNGVFTDDGEKLVTIPVDGANLTEAKFSLPANSLLGKTLLRVAMKYNDEPSSCESYSGGETEDYIVNISTEESTSDYVEIFGQLPKEPTSTSLLSLYPNPSSSQLSIGLSSELQGKNITVIDMIGNTVFEDEFESRMIIDLSSMQAGIYIVRVETEEDLVVSRFIKN